MKPKAIFFMLVTSLLATISVQSQDFMETRLRSAQGDFSTIIGQAGENDLILMDFWATWCKPCVKAIPKMNELHKEFKNKGVSIIGINVDSPRNLNKVRPFVKTHSIGYPVLIDSEQKVMNSLLVNALPTLILVNKEGEVLYTHRGFSSGDEKEIKKEIELHLNR